MSPVQHGMMVVVMADEEFAAAVILVLADGDAWVSEGHLDVDFFCRPAGVEKDAKRRKIETSRRKY